MKRKEDDEDEERGFDNDDDGESRDFTPEPTFLQSLKAASMTYSEALCELVDNSFGAGATQVKIHIVPATKNCRGALVVDDDGIGIVSFTRAMKMRAEKSRREDEGGSTALD